MSASLPDYQGSPDLLVENPTRRAIFGLIGSGIGVLALFPVAIHAADPGYAPLWFAAYALILTAALPMLAIATYRHQRHMIVDIVRRHGRDPNHPDLAGYGGIPDGLGVYLFAFGVLYTVPWLISGVQNLWLWSPGLIALISGVGGMALAIKMDPYGIRLLISRFATGDTKAAQIVAGLTSPSPLTRERAFFEK